MFYVSTIHEKLEKIRNSNLHDEYHYFDVASHMKEEIKKKSLKYH